MSCRRSDTQEACQRVLGLGKAWWGETPHQEAGGALESRRYGTGGARSAGGRARPQRRRRIFTSLITRTHGDASQRASHRTNQRVHHRSPIRAERAECFVQERRESRVTLRYSKHGLRKLVFPVSPLVILTFMFSLQVQKNLIEK